MVFSEINYPLPEKAHIYLRGGLCWLEKTRLLVELNLFKHCYILPPPCLLNLFLQSGFLL